MKKILLVAAGGIGVILLYQLFKNSEIVQSMFGSPCKGKGSEAATDVVSIAAPASVATDKDTGTVNSAQIEQAMDNSNADPDDKALHSFDSDPRSTLTTPDRLFVQTKWPEYSAEQVNI